MNKKIVLVAFYNADSLGIRTLHAILDQKGFEVYSVFFGDLEENFHLNKKTALNDKDIDLLVNFIVEKDPLYVGLGLNSIFFDLAKQVTENIKARTKSLVVWGGMHPTINTLHCLTCADAVCVGEADKVVVEIAETLMAGGDISTIDNLCTKRNGEVIRNKPGTLINDLDSIPFPDFSRKDKFLIKLGQMTEMPSDDKLLAYTCLTTRGCPFNCTYCYSPKIKDIYSGEKFVRRRSVDNVMEELRLVKKQFKNLNFIWIADDVFTMDYPWLKDLSEKYIKEINIPFFCYVHPKTVNEQYISLLKSMGVGIITMGIQSGSLNIRKNHFKRYDTNEEIVKAVTIIHKYKIYATYDMIINNPVETEEDKAEAFDLFLKLPRPFFLDMRVLSHFPGTFLTNTFLENKIISEKDIGHKLDFSFYDWKNFFHMKGTKLDIFWNSIFYFFNFRFMPTWLIVRLRNSKLARRYPGILLMILRFIKLTDYSLGQLGRLRRKVFYNFFD